METINGTRLEKLLAYASKMEVGYEIKVSTVQGLKGVYVFFNKPIWHGLEMFDCVLIEQL